MEKSGCRFICGASKPLMVKRLMVMVMVVVVMVVIVVVGWGLWGGCDGGGGDLIVI